jgi:hypothetical protein
MSCRSISTFLPAQLGTEPESRNGGPDKEKSEDEVDIPWCLLRLLRVSSVRTVVFRVVLVAETHFYCSWFGIELRNISIIYFERRVFLDHVYCYC